MSLLFRLKNRPSSDSELDQNDTIHSQKFREWNFKLAKIFCRSTSDTPQMGLEPTTFELEVQRANPLRHGGLILGLVSLSYILSIPYSSFLSLVLSDLLTFVGG